MDHELLLLSARRPYWFPSVATIILSTELREEPLIDIAGIHPTCFTTTVQILAGVGPLEPRKKKKQGVRSVPHIELPCAAAFPRGAHRRGRRERRTREVRPARGAGASVTQPWPFRSGSPPPLGEVCEVAL